MRQITCGDVLERHVSSLTACDWWSGFAQLHLTSVPVPSGMTDGEPIDTSPRPWRHPRRAGVHWRTHVQPWILREIVRRTRRLRWSRTLLTLLLEELSVNDRFIELCGSVERVPLRRTTQALAVALALRHSWLPADLSRFTNRLGIAFSEDVFRTESRFDRDTSTSASSPSGHEGHDSLRRSWKNRQPTDRQRTTTARSPKRR